MDSAQNFIIEQYLEQNKAETRSFLGFLGKEYHIRSFHESVHFYISSFTSSSFTSQFFLLKFSIFTPSSFTSCKTGNKINRKFPEKHHQKMYTLVNITRFTSMDFNEKTKIQGLQEGLVED